MIVKINSIFLLNFFKVNIFCLFFNKIAIFLFIFVINQSRLVKITALFVFFKNLIDAITVKFMLQYVLQLCDFNSLHNFDFLLQIVNIFHRQRYPLIPEIFVINSIDFRLRFKCALLQVCKDRICIVNFFSTIGRRLGLCKWFTDFFCIFKYFSERAG